MRFLFDGRSLQSQHWSGVPRVADFWLQQLVAQHGAERIDVLTTGWRVPSVQTYGARHVHVRIPNKLLHGLLFVFRFPGLDSLARLALWVKGLLTAPYAHVFVPNLHFFASRAPYTAMVHDMSFLRVPWMLGYFERLVHWMKRPRAFFAQAHALLAVSHSTALDIRTLCGRDDAALFDLRGLVGALQPWTGKRRDFVFLSTTDTRKNLFGAIIGFLTFQKLAPECCRTDKLLIIGALTPAGRRLQRMFAQEQSIVWLSAIDDGTRNTLLMRARALLYPSFFEGYGLPLQEAQRFGTPIITSFGTSMPEVAPKAFLIDPTRPITITQALALLP